jgi:hypothetical protein
MCSPRRLDSLVSRRLRPEPAIWRRRRAFTGATNLQGLVVSVDGSCGYSLHSTALSLLRLPGVPSYGSVLGAPMSCQMWSGSSNAPNWFVTHLVGQPVQSRRRQVWSKWRRKQGSSATRRTSECSRVVRFAGPAASPRRSDHSLRPPFRALRALLLGAQHGLLESPVRGNSALRRARAWPAATAGRGTSWGSATALRTLCVRVQGQRTIRPATSYQNYSGLAAFADAWQWRGDAAPRMEART